MSYKKKSANFFLCLSIIFLLSFIFLSQSVKASWWNSNWEMRRNITINNTQNPNTLTDYQVFINLTYDSDMQSDFSDIRFTWYNSTSQTETEIPYWIKNKVNSQYADIWVKVKEIKAFSYTTIYVYYKNSTVVSSTSNPHNTFDFYDDFSGTNLNMSKWNSVKCVSGVINITNGYLLIYSGNEGAPCSYATVYTANLSTFGINYTLEYDFNYPNSATRWYIEKGFLHDGKQYVSDYNPLNNHYRIRESEYHGTTYLIKRLNGGDTTLTSVSGFSSQSVWHKGRIIWNSTHIIYQVDGATRLSYSITSYDRTQGGIFFSAGGGSSIQTYLYVDNVTVRKFSVPEPTYSVGAEELGNQPPQITIYSPLNQTYFTSNNFEFKFKAIDDNSTTFTLKAWLDGNLEYSNSSYQNNTNITFYKNLTKEKQYNFTVWANDTEGKYYSSTVLFFLNIYDLTLTSSNYTTFNNTNYARTVIISLNVRCGINSDYLSYLNTTANTNLIDSRIVICDNSTQFFNFSYTHSSEGDVSIVSKLYEANLTDIIVEQGLFNYKSDLNPPNINIVHNITYGFLSGNSIQINVSVSDTISPIQYCNQTLINLTYTNRIYGNNQTSDNANLVDGLNNILSKCWDLANNTAINDKSLSLAVKELILKDSDSGQIFNSFSDYSKLMILSENSNFSFNFLSTNTSKTFFINNFSDFLKLDLSFNDGTKFYSEYYTPLIEAKSYLCIPKIQKLYEILLYSTTEKSVYIKNFNTDCIKLASKTRYALADALTQRMFGIAKHYYLYLFDSQGRKVYLSTIDGSLAQSINLDALIFRSKQSTFALSSDDLSISKISNTTLYIYYKNLKGDSVRTNIVIYDGNNVVFNITETTNPNEFSAYFDYSTLNLQNNMLKIILTKQDTSGLMSKIERIFNLQGSFGLIPPAIAIAFSSILLFFTLTFTATRFTFGWFGIIMVIIALSISALAPQSPEIIFMEVINIIILIYIIILYKEEYSKVS
ncbi:MAG: DUF2341 domain-containing protein [Candidatus Aenigmatarchaeota archaeon]